MPKSSLILAVMAVAMTTVAAGLWFTRPPDSEARVAMLEARLREADAVIARLNKQHSATSATHAAPGGSTISSISSEDPAHPGILGNKMTGATTAAGGNPPPEAAASTTNTPVVKSDKRLAEAEARYSDLINQFGLQPDEKEAFKNLAAKRDDIRKGVFSKLADPSLTPAQRQAILAQGKAEMG
ncbi:MAG: hypothetical protein JWO94_2152, partial [Verrucomicrobiaceae bacterium]|nr:hypothetical protein [Verrucomicrobiaceae bacterium]